MDAMEHVFYQTDFSKYTDLKSQLADKLFKKKTFKKTISFTPLSEGDLEYVNAAQGIQSDLFIKKKEKQ